MKKHKTLLFNILNVSAGIIIFFGAYAPLTGCAADSKNLFSDILQAISPDKAESIPAPKDIIVEPTPIETALLARTAATNATYAAIVEERKPYTCEKDVRFEDTYKIGNVWTPSHGNVNNIAKVIFSSRKYPKQFKRVALLSPDKKTLIQKLQFLAFANPDAGILRQHWGTTTITKRLPKKAVLYADGLCFKLENTHVRLD